MKKTYQSPKTKLMLMSSEQLLTQSNNYGQPELGQDLSEVGTTDATSGNLGRRRRQAWDDEEDEEEFY